MHSSAAHTVDIRAHASYARLARVALHAARRTMHINHPCSCIIRSGGHASGIASSVRSARSAHPRSCIICPPGKPRNACMTSLHTQCPPLRMQHRLAQPSVQAARRLTVASPAHASYARVARPQVHGARFSKHSAHTTSCTMRSAQHLATHVLRTQSSSAHAVSMRSRARRL